MIPAPGSSSLPVVSTPLTSDQVRDRLLTASKRGRLPGYQPGGSGLFSVSAHGRPFDGVLSADLRGDTLTFSVRMLRRLPAVFAVVLVLTIWPGVYFMDELVAQFVPSLWWPWVTYYWYIPITVLPLPWMWRSLMRKSRTSIDTSAREAIEKIATEVNGTVSQPTPR